MAVPMLLPWLFRAGLGALLGLYIQEALRKSGTATKAWAKKPNEKGAIGMSYELVGAELMGLVAGLDDDEGAIGAADEDLLQALSVSGMGGTEIIGAAERRGAQKALNAIKSRRGMAVVQNPPSRRRRMPLGYTPTTITAASTATIPGSPQNVYRTERLVVPSDIAFDLGVTDMKVGNASQFVQTTEVPAVLFSEVAINTGVEFDTAEIGNQISLSLRNKDAVNDLVFTAATVGTVAK